MTATHPGADVPYRIITLIDTTPDAAADRLVWLAEDAGGVPVGSAALRLPAVPGRTHVAEVEIHVHPAERRRGIGAGLLDAVAAGARDAGRRIVVTTHVEQGSPADGFFAARGLRLVLTLTYARLPLADIEPAAPVASAPPGYRLVTWSGTVPANLETSFAAARRAMDDMPMDAADVGLEIWDTARLRAVARAVADRGDLLETVAALDVTDGSVVGFTELVVPGGGTGDAQHYGTAVLPEHRGHGLARWMKAAAIRRTRERYPDVAGLLTDTADSNSAMRRINDELGYRPTHRSRMYQLDLR